jgi:hypothetical protein
LRIRGGAALSASVFFAIALPAGGAPKLEVPDCKPGYDPELVRVPGGDPVFKCKKTPKRSTRQLVAQAVKHNKFVRGKETFSFCGSKNYRHGKESGRYVIESARITAKPKPTGFRAKVRLTPAKRKAYTVVIDRAQTGLKFDGRLYEFGGPARC